MALVNYVAMLASHEFAGLLHYRITQPTLYTNAFAISVLESEPALNRTLTAQELTWLGELITGLDNADFTANDFEKGSIMLKSQWITPARFLEGLGF